MYTRWFAGARYEKPRNREPIPSGEKFEKPMVISSGLRYSVVEDESNKTINMSERSQVHDMITRQ